MYHSKKSIPHGIVQTLIPYWILIISSGIFHISNIQLRMINIPCGIRACSIPCGIISFKVYSPVVTLVCRLVPAAVVVVEAVDVVPPLGEVVWYQLVPGILLQSHKMSVHAL